MRWTFGSPNFGGGSQVVVVRSLSRDPPPPVAPVPVPAVGKRWGRPADWAGLSAAAREPERQSGGLTLLSPIYRTSTRVHQMAPVYRWYDVLKVRSRDNPDVTIEIERTTAVLIPLGQVNEQRLSGGGFSGGRWVPSYRGVNVARYLRLRLDMPLPDGNYEFVRQGEEGEYPDLPVDYG